MISKVLHIITGLRDGGAESSLYRLVINDNHYEHIVVSLISEEKYSYLLKEKGIKLYHLNFNSLFNIPKASLKLFQIIKNENPDVVQTWMYHSDLLGGIIAKIAGVKKIYWCIRNSTLNFKHSSFATLVIRRLCAFMSWFIPNGIISVSSDSIKHHVKKGYRAKLFYLIPNGIDSTRFTKANINNFGIFVLGMVGRFDPQKDLETLFKALNLFSNTKVNFILKIAGNQMNSDNHELITLIEKYDLSHQVKLYGQVDNIESFYSQINYLILTSSFGEAFPNVIAEAMCSGVPCIATNVGDTAKIIGDCGWIVQPKDYYSVAISLYKAWYLFDKFEESYNQLSIKSTNRIQFYYSLSSMIDNYNLVWSQSSNK